MNELKLFVVEILLNAKNAMNLLIKMKLNLMKKNFIKKFFIKFHISIRFLATIVNKKSKNYN